nr:hypothetical protein [Bradyrhizobium lablabi]
MEAKQTGNVAATALGIQPHAAIGSVSAALAQCRNTLFHERIAAFSPPSHARRMEPKWAIVQEIWFNNRPPVSTPFLVRPSIKFSYQSNIIKYPIAIMLSQNWRDLK